MTHRPPSGRARRSRVPWWARVMAATMERPRPLPWPVPVRSAPRRRKGCARSATRRWSRTGPPDSTARDTAPASSPSACTATLIQPPGSLCVIALSTMLSTARRSSVWLPHTQAESSIRFSRTVRPLAAMSFARPVRAVSASRPRARRPESVNLPCWVRARTRKLSSSRSTWSSSARIRAASVAVVAGTGPGLARATSREARIVVSGVRSSWEALATKRRWASKEPSRRPRRSSMVSARSFTSSPGPLMARRSCRLSAVIRRVAAVITRSGRSTRPATNQPSPTETTAMTPRAMAEPSRICRDWVSCAWASCCASSSMRPWACAAVAG